MTEKENEESVEVSMASTACRNCFFADYDENIQIGCKAGRLEKFSQAGIKIIQLNKDSEGKTSFIIDGKTCVYYRNHEWIESQYKDLSDEQVKEKVQSQLRIPYHVLLFVRKGNTIKDVDIRLAELQNQKVPPKMVTLIDRSHTTDIILGEMMKLFQNYSFDHWRVQSIQAVDQVDSDVIDLVSDSTKKIQYMFYMVFECDFPIPSLMSEDLHKSLHDDMKAFVVLQSNKNGVGYGALKAAHAKYTGNSFGISLEDKIIHYEDSPHLIKKVEDICPSLQVS